MIHVIVSKQVYSRCHIVLFLYFIGGRDIQIMLDVICSQGGIVGTQKTDFGIQDIPVYFSNVSQSRHCFLSSNRTDHVVIE